MDTQGLGGNWFVKKTRSRKSRDTVPLREKNNLNLVAISIDREITYSLCFNQRKQKHIE